MTPADEHVFAVHLEIGVAAAEEPREQTAEALVGLVERFFEPRARLAIDLADRVLERLERFGEIRELRVEILLALGLLLELVDRRQVDRAEPLNPALELLERLVPDGGRRIGGQAPR